MFCPYCGRILEGDEMFCPECGAITELGREKGTDQQSTVGNLPYLGLGFGMALAITFYLGFRFIFLFIPVFFVRGGRSKLAMLLTGAMLGSLAGALFRTVIGREIL